MSGGSGERMTNGLTTFSVPAIHKAEGRRERAHRVIRLALLSLLVAMSAYSAFVHSPTVDESAHLAAGLSHWEFARFELYVVNPPLVRMIAALPVKLLGYRMDWTDVGAQPQLRPEFPAGKSIVRANGPRSIILFAAARLALLPVLVAGAWMCALWSDAVYSREAGTVALGLFCFNPMVLGHGSLITPDIGATVAGVGVFWIGRKWLKTGDWWSTVLLGAAVGIALLTKFTWIVVIPCSAIVIVTVFRGMEVLSWRCAGQLAVSSLLALYVVNVAYGFDETGTSVGDIKFVSDELHGPPHGLRQNRFSDSVLSEIPVPLPLCYVQGIDIQKWDFDRGMRSYLMGEWKHGGWWHYYSIGFLVKEPLPFLMLLGVAVASGFSFTQWTPNHVRECVVLMVPPVLTFVIVSSQTGFNHHMRYVLPAYPFLCIFASKVVVLGRFWRRLTYGLLLWQFCIVLWFAPHWMSYFNEFAGGPKNGHKWLVNSNIDWGQDILMLKWWQDKHPEATPLNAAMFTMFDPADIGLKYQSPAPFLKGHPEVISKDGFRGPQPGWYAVSVCMLKGLHFDVPDGDGNWSSTTEHFTYFLDNFEPVDMIGYSIYIYHISEEDAARVRAKLLAEEAEWLRKAESGERKAEGGPG